MTSGKRLLAKVAPYVRMARGINSPYRLAIMYMVAKEGPLRPEDIASHLPIPQNLIAHHLKCMVETGWLKKRRVGNLVLYTLHKKTFRELPLLLIDTAFWKDLQKKNA